MLSALLILISAFLSTAAFGVAIQAPAHFEITTQLRGVDVSFWQGDINWFNVVGNGISFAYIKATEGITYKNTYFPFQYADATRAGLILGAYHVARPSDHSSGPAQASWFVAKGGNWSDDGITLPGALYLEYGILSPCHGLSPASMVNWIRGFSDTYYILVGRYPVIYTSTSWWRTCTGDSPVFGSTNPLWIVSHPRSIGILPNGWSNYTFWQYAELGPNPGGQDYFNGNMASLRRLAAG